MCLILVISSLLVTGLISESVYVMFCKVHCLFILIRQVFECCWLKETMATKVFIPRVITHYTHLKFRLHKETLKIYDETYAVLDSQIHRSISFFKTLIVSSVALSMVNIGLDVDSTCMFGSYPLKNIICWSL